LKLHHPTHTHTHTHIRIHNLHPHRGSGAAALSVFSTLFQPTRSTFTVKSIYHTNYISSVSQLSLSLSHTHTTFLPNIDVPTTFYLAPLLSSIPWLSFIQLPGLVFGSKNDFWKVMWHWRQM